MKALTLIQPWATLIIEDKKWIETRSWPIKYRGPLAIHASKKVDKVACERFGYDPKKIPTGVVLGFVKMTNCVQFPSVLAPEDEYGDFTAGRYGFILTDVRRLDAPVAWKGSLGLWEYDGPFSVDPFAPKFLI